jgi:tagatose-1,6-bisphosphate aldolase non-catalytic subunit AgaZ/GatZ
MKKKTMLLATEEEVLLDLTMHDVPATLISEFVQKIVTPYYNGNLNMAIKDLINKALSEQDYVYSHITHIKKQPKSGR